MPPLMNRHTETQWHESYEDRYLKTKLRNVSIVGDFRSGLTSQIDRSPRSIGVVGATSAWGHQNSVRNEPGSPYGGRTAHLRGVRQEYFSLRRLTKVFK